MLKIQMVLFFLVCAWTVSDAEQESSGMFEEWKKHLIVENALVDKQALRLSTFQRINNIKYPSRKYGYSKDELTQMVEQGKFFGQNQLLVGKKLFDIVQEEIALTKKKLNLQEKIKLSKIFYSRRRIFVG